MDVPEPSVFHAAWRFWRCLLHFQRQPDNGTYTMSKASGLKPGAGWIILYRSLVTSPSGTGFKSATVVDAAAATGIEVQWL
jgi:hypothetical protein